MRPRLVLRWDEDAPPLWEFRGEVQLAVGTPPTLPRHLAERLELWDGDPVEGRRLARELTAELGERVEYRE